MLCNRFYICNTNLFVDRPRFSHPINTDDKVFAFADAPHLLKLIRNHFIDKGFVINNHMLSCSTIESLLKYTYVADTSITFKLSDENLSVKGPGMLICLNSQLKIILINFKGGKR